MNNVFDLESPERINNIYDLKGSTYGRITKSKKNSENSVKKDLNLIEENTRIFIPYSIKNKLMR